MGSVQAVTGYFADDEVVKTAIADYAFKHYEIGCYRSLSAAADEANDFQTKQVYEDILREEQELADRTGELVPQLTHRYVSLDASGQEAKV